MNSPFTGGKVVKQQTTVTLTFRNEEYTVKRFCYRCIDTGKTFSNAEVDELAIQEVHEQYRKRHRIPFPEDLKRLRAKYGFSAHTMSKIAGIGINQYSKYENGELPTLTMARRLSSLFSKEDLLKCIEESKDKLKDSYIRVRDRVVQAPEEKQFALAKESYADFSLLPAGQYQTRQYKTRRPTWARVSF